MWLGVRGEVVQQHKQAMEAALEHEAAVKELGTTYEEAVVNAAFDEPLETDFDIVDAMLQFGLLLLLICFILCSEIWCMLA